MTQLALKHRLHLRECLWLGADSQAGGVDNNPGAGMPTPPAGYHWDFVTSNGQQVASNGVSVVALVANGS